MSEQEQPTDLEKAFQERMDRKTSNKVMKKKVEREREAKRQAKKPSFMPTMPDDVPKYCTLKTQTFYDFMTEVGTMSQHWKKEAKNLNIVNPGNPAGILLSTNTNRIADELAAVLQKYVAIIQLDNIEMQEEVDNARRIIEQVEPVDEEGSPLDDGEGVEEPVDEGMDGGGEEEKG
jgi:hypothetical protein